MKNKSFLSAVFTLATFQISFAQAPICGQDHFYEMGTANCIWRYSITNTSTPNGANPVLPNGALGLAIGPNFFSANPATTYYTVLNGNYFYYNGTSFVNTGHSAGGTGFDNPGGSANFIYNLNSAGQVSKYNGTGSATVITTHTILAGTGISQDIAGDANDNYYIVKTSSPASISCFNSASSLIATYALLNLPGTGSFSHGFSLNKGYLTVSPQVSGGAAIGRLSNNVIEFGPLFQLACGGAVDMATCPIESYLVPAIRGVPSASLPCNGGTIALTSDDPSNSQTYAWSGPGIVGTGTSQSITVNSTGVYTRTMSTIAGVADVSTFTVYQGNWLPLQVVASSTVKCDYDAAVTLSVSGLGNYIWSPAASLSSATGSLVSASPVTTTNYTITGAANGCVGSTIVTVAAAPLASPVIVSPSNSICIGATALLAGNGGSYTMQWLPSNLTGSFLILSPTVTSTYSLVLSNAIGCSKTATATIEVFNYPNFTATASQAKICLGESAGITMSGASSYTVMPGNLNGAQVAVMPSASTQYTISGANWICSTTQQVFIDVMPLPQFSVSSSVNQICAGQSASISASGNGNTYTLLPGNLSGNAVVVNPTASQVYTMVASNQSCTANQTVALAVNPLPHVVIGTSKMELCVGESAELLAVGASNFTWTNGNTGSQLQASPVTTTTYQVQGLGNNGCVGTGSLVLKVNECTGIEKFADVGSIRFYPNPGNGQIEIEANSVPKTARIEVRNYLGQVVFESSISESIDITAFAKGVYVVSVLDNTTTLYHVIFVLQ